MKTGLMSRSGMCTTVALTLFFAGCGGGTSPIECSGTSGAKTACTVPDFLYATAQKEILGFTINPTSGALGTPTVTPGPGLTVSGITIPSYGIVNTQGFVYVSDPQNNQVDGFSVNNSTGALTPLSDSPFPLPGLAGLPEGMAANAHGKFLYVANAGTIDALAINNATGALTAVPGSPFASGTNLEITVDPSGKFLFASDDDPPGDLLAFTIDPGTGALTPVVGSPFALPIANSRPFVLAVDSSGSFVYTVVSNMTGSYVAGFSIDASGALTLVSGFPVIEDSLSPFAIATSGSFLFVRSGLGISVFSIASGTGVLAEINGSPFPAGAATGGMAMAPNGKFLYETAPDSINIFAIDPATGTVTTSGNSAPAAGEPLVLSFY